jgi:hypothetical protein
MSKNYFVPLLILLACLFLSNKGCSRRQKKFQRSSEHHQRVAENRLCTTKHLPTRHRHRPLLCSFLLSGVLRRLRPRHLTLLAPFGVRRLNITMGSQQTADPAARPRSPSLECATSPVAEAEWSLDAVAPSYQRSPEICCSQFRLQRYELSRHYPTPPPSPPKDQYFAPSESEAESSNSEESTCWMCK